MLVSDDSSLRRKAEESGERRTRRVLAPTAAMGQFSPREAATLMILTCPSCATRYQADAAKFLPAGRNVKCAKCGHVWHQGAPATEPEPEAVLVAQAAAPAAAAAADM